MNDSSILIDVLIQPGSSKDEIAGFLDSRLKIRISAPPARGKANKRLIKFMSKLFGIPQSNVGIIKGKSSKLKTMKVSGISEEQYNLFISKYRSE